MTDALAEAIKEAILPEIRSLIDEAINRKASKELEEKLLSPDEATKVFIPQISRPTLYNWMDAGYINSYFIGGKRVFKYSELIAAVTKVKKYSRHNQKR